MKTVTVNIYVTARDIDQGEPFNPAKCPVGRAVNRRLRKQYIALVSPGHVSIIYHPETIHRQITLVRLPERAMDFINEFDGYHEKTWKSNPFTFRLQIPRSVLKK